MTLYIHNKKENRAATPELDGANITFDEDRWLKCKLEGEEAIREYLECIKCDRNVYDVMFLDGPIIKLGRE